MYSRYFLVAFFAILYTIQYTNGGDDGFKREKTHIKKDPRDYTDRDVDSLFEEWEVKFNQKIILFILYINIFIQDNDEDVLPEDERHDAFLRGKNRPSIRPEDLVGKEPEQIMKLSKKGQTLMMFATVSGSPTRRETEEISQLWWASLKNAFYDVNR